MTFNLDWQDKASSAMNSTLPNLPKTSKTLFLYTIQGSDKASKTDLIRCSNCFLTVHQVCYGIKEDPGTSWLCDRCESNAFIAVCVL